MFFDKYLHYCLHDYLNHHFPYLSVAIISSFFGGKTKPLDKITNMSEQVIVYFQQCLKNTLETLFVTSLLIIAM